ncbi:hypothetical protein Q8A73_005975 [Channa argus]|nr:hypothetical protein Q8A73_005975 [Channa argus]
MDDKNVDILTHINVGGNLLSVITDLEKPLRSWSERREVSKLLTWTEFYETGLDHKQKQNNNNNKSSSSVSKGASRVSASPVWRGLTKGRKDGIRTFCLPLQHSMEVFLDTCATPTVTYLLAICLCFLKAAADCPKPEGSTNTILTDEALLLNAFPEGTKVSFECANGHDKEKGSEFITCIDGKWSELDLTCKRKDCGQPEPQPNMRFDISAGTLFGAQIRAICDKGYEIRGPSYMNCYNSGWGRKPRCEMVTCEKPTEVINGRSSWNSEDDPQYGEIINFSCNEGYTLVGKSSIVCSETGDYDSPPPKCEETSTSSDSSATATTPTVSSSSQAACPKPVGSNNTVLTNEALLLNDYPDRINVTFECVNGYVKEKGSEFITCIDGKWSEPDLTCKRKDCGQPEPQPNMRFDISAGTLFGDVIEAICDKGYEIRGPSYMTCYDSGWSRKPRCEMVTCEKPTEVINGRSSWNSEDDPKYGEIINFSCNEGYTLVGKATIVCSKTGEYDSPPPKCEAVVSLGSVEGRPPLWMETLGLV